MQPHRRSLDRKEFQPFPHAISLILALLKLSKCFWIADKTLTRGSESFHIISIGNRRIGMLWSFSVSRHRTFESNFILTAVGICSSCNRTTSLSDFCDVLYVNLQYLIIPLIIFLFFWLQVMAPKSTTQLSVRTTTAEVKCPVGQTIRFLYANYGRRHFLKCGIGLNVKCISVNSQTQVSDRWNNYFMFYQTSMPDALITRLDHSHSLILNY